MNKDGCSWNGFHILFLFLRKENCVAYTQAFNGYLLYFFVAYLFYFLFDRLHHVPFLETFA